jgi:hypothetical protein
MPIRDLSGFNGRKVGDETSRPPGMPCRAIQRQAVQQFPMPFRGICKQRQAIGFQPLFWLSPILFGIFASMSHARARVRRAPFS